MSMPPSPRTVITTSCVGGAGALGRSLAEAAQQVPGSPAVVERSIPYPSDDPQWAMYENAFLQQPVGMWIGPLRTEAGWRIMQVMDKQVVQQKWEDLPDAVRQNIASSASELARDQRFRMFTDSLATAYQVKVDQAQVAKLRWPEPVPPGLQMN